MVKHLNKPAYVLLTAARNEEAYIQKPLDSVVSQTVKPKKWIIVDDGSEDGTAEIVKSYQAQNDFIELVETAGDPNRNFGSKAKAINFAYQRLNDIEFDFVGNLDADISFDTSYYEKVFSKFKANPKLGLAGGIRFDLVDREFVRVNCARNSVGGPFQLFRRECFDIIGGYVSSPYGGIDAIAEVMTRMHGWEVECFSEIKAYHYRATGTANNGRLGKSFKYGIRDYALGYHPLFQVLRAVARIRQKPYLVGSLIWMCGYIWGGINRPTRPVSKDFLRYFRSEQLARLRTPLITARGEVARR